MFFPFPMWDLLLHKVERTNGKTQTMWDERNCPSFETATGGFGPQSSRVDLDHSPFGWIWTTVLSGGFGPQSFRVDLDPSPLVDLDLLSGGFGSQSSRVDLDPSPLGWIWTPVLSGASGALPPTYLVKMVQVVAVTAE